MENLQYQTSNGTWVDCGTGDTHGHYGLIANTDKNYIDLTDEKINQAEKYINNHPNKTSLLGKFPDVRSALSAGKKIGTGTDWYDKIRIKPVPRLQTVEMKKCDCGHTIPKNLVMSANVGTSCCDCYDRMSL